MSKITIILNGDRNTVSIQNGSHNAFDVLYGSRWEDESNKVIDFLRRQGSSKHLEAANHLEEAEAAARRDDKVTAKARLRKAGVFAWKTAESVGAHLLAMLIHSSLSDRGD